MLKAGCCLGLGDAKGTLVLKAGWCLRQVVA